MAAQDARTSGHTLMYAGFFFLIAFLAPRGVSASVVERQIELHDVSGATSPIRVSGRVAFRCDSSNSLPFSYKVSFAARNVSAKSIVMMALHIDAMGLGGPGHDEKYLQDYFFSDAVAPGDSDIHDSQQGSFGQSVNDKPMTCAEPDPNPLASVKVEFIQFGDGSTWGDPAFAKAGFERRREMLAELDRLEHVYEQAGADAFLGEFQQQDNFTIHVLKNHCLGKEASLECLDQGILRMLGAARTHEADMGSGIVLKAPPSR
jgi:hypothetical protein